MALQEDSASGNVDITQHGEAIWAITGARAE